MLSFLLGQIVDILWARFDVEKSSVFIGLGVVGIVSYKYLSKYGILSLMNRLYFGKRYVLSAQIK
jgi:hypothetical protein